MEFPDDILQLIHAFSKPMGRNDWRTCKQHESNIILWHNRYTLNLCWYTYIETRMMADEIATWTLHGRRRAIRHLIENPFPQSPFRDNWYETRIQTFDQEIS